MRDSKLSIIYALVGVAALALLVYLFGFSADRSVSDLQGSEASITDPVDLSSESSYDRENIQRLLDRNGLTTDSTKASINTDLILSGGPGKDGIPSIDEPVFTTVQEADDTIKEDTRGVYLSINGDTRFYPYNILVWHELVNDTVGGERVVVSFCPLCGSAVVFSSEVNGEDVDFGVSGLLFESNLLMYDRETETLWSQIIGEAVIGEHTGEKLEILDMRLMTFDEFTQLAPGGKVLSTDTGYRRDYERYPYGSYDTNDEIIFPVQNEDKRFFAKEVFYIINTDDRSVAFKLDQLEREEVAEVEFVNDDEESVSVTAQYDSSTKEITVTDDTGRSYPGFFGMWFSWADHHQEDGVVWGEE